MDTPEGMLPLAGVKRTMAGSALVVCAIARAGTKRGVDANMRRTVWGWEDARRIAGGGRRVGDSCKVAGVGATSR